MAKITTRNIKNLKYTKRKKELIVEEDRRNQLDAKLKEMIKHLEQAEAKHKNPQHNLAPAMPFVAGRSKSQTVLCLK